MPWALGAGVWESYRARGEPLKYPNLAARWEGGGQSQVGIIQCPGGCANFVEVKPSPKARLEGTLPSPISGPCIPVGSLHPEVGHASD